MGAFDWTSGNWHTDSLKDMGLQTTGNSKHHVISTKMAETVSNRDKPLVVQFTGASCCRQLFEQGSA
jgi:hypothetical protein